MRLTKRRLLSATNRDGTRVFKNASTLAAAIGVTRSYVCQWGDDDPIPELYELRLRYSPEYQLKPKVNWRDV